MIVSIHQPNYLPWSGFFHKMAACDRFVLLDTVPYSKNSYQNRCRIRTPRGAQWLTVPVLSTGHFAEPTNELRIKNEAHWAGKHWRTLAQHYGRTPFFAEFASKVDNVFTRRREYLAALNAELIAQLAVLLKISTPIVEASTLDATGSRSELLCGICRTLGATTYLSGPSGRNYLDPAVFAAAGIEVRYHEFEEPVYDQGPGDFIPGLSVVDRFCRLGPQCLEPAMEPGNSESSRSEA